MPYHMTSSPLFSQRPMQWSSHPPQFRSSSWNCCRTCRQTGPQQPGEIYFNQSLAPSTHRTYQAATKRFSDFCSEFHISTPYPLTQHLLCQYVSYLGSQGLSPATIKVYLSALRHCQISMGMPSADHASMPKLQAVQVGVAKTHARSAGVRDQNGFPLLRRYQNGLELVSNRARYNNELGYLHTSLLWILSAGQNCTHLHKF